MIVVDWLHATRKYHESVSVGLDPTRRFPGKFPELAVLTHSQISSRISGNLEQGQHGKEQNDPYIPFEAAWERVLCTCVDRVGRSVSPKA